MVNWNSQYDSWKKDYTNTKKEKYDKIINNAASNNGLTGNNPRINLFEPIKSFYESKVAKYAAIDELSFEINIDKQKKIFSKLLIKNALPSNNWNKNIKTGKDIDAHFKSGLVDTIKEMEKRIPAPKPVTQYNANIFKAMGADISLVYMDGNKKKVYQATGGKVVRDGKKGNTNKDAEQNWINAHGNDLIYKTKHLRKDDKEPLTLELHIKARPCHDCGPFLNNWIKTNNDTFGNIPLNVFTYHDDQNGQGKNAYRIDPGVNQKSKYLGKWG